MGLESGKGKNHRLRAWITCKFEPPAGATKLSLCRIEEAKNQPVSAHAHIKPFPRITDDLGEAVSIHGF